VSFHIEITRTAAREVEQRYDDLSARSKPAAERWRSGLLKAVEALGQNPERCPQAPEAEWHGDSLRELYYGRRRNTYRILFEVRGSTIYILRVRHGRQDYLNPEELRGPPPPDE
jgi:plasmid stabilization system protein ParE